jgi:Ser/Thr protein kinase RdoA (MazF antagonist)
VIPSSHWLPDVSLLEHEITRRYDLGPIAECVLVHQSFNYVYLIVTPVGRFVLRVSGARSQTASGISYEVELLRHLAGRGVLVARPVATREGAFVWNIAAPEGPRTAVLFTYAPGEHPGKPFPSKAFGQTAATLHEALHDFVSPQPQTGLDWRYLVDEPVGAVQSFVGHRPTVGNYLMRVATALRHRLDELAKDLEVGACHGDLHGRNAHVAPDGTITLFDFECCGPGWRAYELAVFRWWQHFTTQPEEYWTSYLAAYQERRRLGQTDLAAIPLFVAVRHIRLLGAGVWLADRGLWRPDDQHFDRRLTSLAGWLAEHDDLGSGSAESWSWPEETPA